jgi:Rrf2 family protein
MKISTKTRHALRMMLDFALHRGEGFISLRDVSFRMGVSKTYLEQIMMQINKTDLLTAARGAAGGYKLARAADKCTVGDILRAMEGNLSVFASDGEPAGDDRLSIMADGVWTELEALITERLDSLSLQDILDRNQSYAGYDYTI